MLTALSPSIGSGSGMRWMPSATSKAPGAVQCSPESGDTAYAVGVLIGIPFSERRDAGAKGPAGCSRMLALCRAPDGAPVQPDQPGDRQDGRHPAVPAAVVRPHRRIGEPVLP